MGFLAGKRAVIVGLASTRSIAYGIAQAMHREGAELAFSYQTEKLAERVKGMAAELGSDICLPLDVADDAEIDGFFARLGERWDRFDILVHSVAYAPADQLEGRYLDAVNREGFRIAHDVSSYSLAALAKKAEPLMAGRAGAMRKLLEANVRFLALDLGPSNIRINAISAGPIRTLAASGVKGLRQMIAKVAETSPLKRNITIEDVGNAAAFLCSDLAAGITGQTIYVDAGYNIVGMSFDG